MSSATNSRQPRYSVIIVTYNSRENIRVCLDSVRNSARFADGAQGAGSGRLADGAGAGSGGYEIIVVDNNSRDGTGEFLAAQGDVRAILNGENHGFSKGCNQGAAIAAGEFLIFLNPDTLVTEGWADAMSRYFRDPSVGAVGPVSNYVAGLQRLDLNLPAEWRDGRKIPGDGAVEVSANVARILKEANTGRGVTTKLLIGFCLMMPRALYESLDGMDENLFLGNDDLDLSWRLRNLGRKLVVASDAFVFHEGQKSFRTEAKTTVDRLTQESTDAMYMKLVHHYGGRDLVPAPVDLWGIGWFHPSPSLLHGPVPALPVRAGLSQHKPAEPTRPPDRKHKPEANVENESRDKSAWKSVTVVIYVDGNDSGVGSEAASARLERTLATLPGRPGVEIIILNCAGSLAAPEAPAGAALRKLDLGTRLPAKQALEIAAALIAGSHGLFLLAGAQASALFNHWLDKCDLENLGASLPLPLRIGEGPAAACAAYAFLFRKSWLQNALSALPMADTGALLSALGDRLTRETANRNASVPIGPAGKSIDPPWLMIRASDAPANAAQQAGPAPAPQVDGFALYPESLRAHMRAAKDIGFAGTTAEPPPKTGAFRAFDPKGNLVPVSGQDLIILRVTPELIDGLPERMANIRRLAPALKRLIAVFDGAQARRIAADSALAPVDLTPEGIRNALWRSGFAVTGEQAYRGFPNGTKDGEILQGWTQVEAVPRSAAHDTGKLVSIIMLGFNQVEYTRKCIESIRKYTRQKYELILVDNGSKDGTEEFFRSIPGAKVIRNEENLGVSRGWNQGMRLAAGEYLLILNNDIIVGPDWLENMVRLAESHASIGLVGPRSNYIAGPQVVADVPYKAESGIQDFIRAWQGEHALSAAEFGFIKGFCHLIPRRVFAKVGFYDERFGKGNFEDDDYCMRVRLHGFRALFADDSFIHHYGSVSFNQDSVDWRALMIENREKYEKKWSKGAAALHDTQVSPPASTAPAGPSAALSALSPVRVQSESSKLEQGRAAYESGDLTRARQLFLEAQAQAPSDPEPYCALGALMYSGGSTREAIAFFMRSLNIRPDHADAAQNLLECLADGNGDVSPGELAALASRYPSNPFFAPAAARRPDAAPHGSGRPAAAEAAWSPAPIVPIAPITPMAPIAPAAPAAKPALPAWRLEVEARIQAGKYALALDSLEKRVRANEDPGACYNYMGIIAHACGDAEMALRHFATALQRAPGETDILFNLSDTLIAVGRYGDAAALLEDSARKTGVESDPDLPDLAATAEQIRHAMAKGEVDRSQLLASRDANQQAEKLLRAGANAEAKAYLDAALEADGEDFRALNNLGLMAWYERDGEAAWRYFQRCLAVRPAWTDALVNAFDTAMALRDMGMMRPCLDNALAHAPGHAQASAMRRHMQAQGPAIHCFRSFEALEANATALRRAEAALEQARQGDAIHIYLETVQCQPQNPQAYNGLGVIAFGEKRYADAFSLFEAASGLNPMDQDILMNFWQCAQALRREGEVLPKLKHSLERNPALEDVKAIVKEYA